MIVDGKMQYLFDETGRRYLDVGHASCWHYWQCLFCFVCGLCHLHVPCHLCLSCWQLTDQQC